MRIAIVGAGVIGERRAQAMPKGCKVAAVVDTNSERAWALAQKFQTKPYDSVESMLKSESINAAIIATVNSAIVPLDMDLIGGLRLAYRGRWGPTTGRCPGRPTERYFSRGHCATRTRTPMEGQFSTANKGRVALIGVAGGGILRSAAAAAHRGGPLDFTDGGNVEVEGNGMRRERLGELAEDAAERFTRRLRVGW